LERADVSGFLGGVSAMCLRRLSADGYPSPRSVGVAKHQQKRSKKS